MSFELKQQLRMSQQLVVTPPLQLAIKLLQLSHLERETLIRSELEQNPMLEETTTSTVAENQAEAKEELSSIERFVGEVDSVQVSNEAQPEALKGEVQNEIDWESYLDNYLLSPSTPSNRGLAEELPGPEASLTRPPTLFDHLMSQVGFLDLSDEEKRAALLILGNLDEQGYFRIEGLEGDPLIPVAYEAGVSFQVAASALAKLQTLEPIGCCARDLEECLLLQARAAGEEDTLVGEIIRRHLGDLEAKNLKAICEGVGADRESVVEAIRIIESFDPKPARHFAGEEPRYITPDVYIHKVGGEYVVQVNDDGLSKLRVSNRYRDALRNAQGDAGSKGFIQDKLRSAVWLIRSIHQRQRTIHKVTESIIKFQREFLDKGVAYLKPMILKDVADDIGMHESTVSRVTTNKYVHTPQGTFELKYFFNSAINRTGGDEIASEAVKQEIRKIVASENPKAPYSDQKIADLLKENGIEIARRTVAKYREMLGILPSSKRKRLY